MCNYPDFVNKDKIECYPEKEKYRYYLKIDFVDIANTDKTVMIIMQNPSKADKICSDKTVNRVLKCFHEFGYSKVIIMNIIPFYATKIAHLSNAVLKEEDKINVNCEEIYKQSKLADKIFVAWGWASTISSCCYNKRVKQVKEVLEKIRAQEDNKKEIVCYEINKSNGQPRHPRRWDKLKKENEFVPFIY